MPLMKKLSSCSALDSTLRVAGCFFSLLEQRGKGEPGSLMRKVSTCTSPCADDQRVPCAASRACGTSLVGRPMRMPVAGSTTTLQPNSSSCALAAAIRSARSAGVSTPVTLALWRFWKFLIAVSIGSSPAAMPVKSPDHSSAAWIFWRSPGGNAGERVGRGLGGGFRRGGFGRDGLVGCRFWRGRLYACGLRRSGFRRGRLGRLGPRFGRLDRLARPLWLRRVWPWPPPFA